MTDHQTTKANQKEKEGQVKKLIDEKIDEFNEESFPASDPPNWSALKDFKNKTTKPTSKGSGSADR